MEWMACAQLVRHGGHVVGFALVIQQHPGSERRLHGVTERAAHLALTDFTVQVIRLEDPLRQFLELRVELVKASKTVRMDWA